MEEESDQKMDEKPIMSQKSKSLKGSNESSEETKDS
jgi:hypothetical protein